MISNLSIFFTFTFGVIAKKPFCLPRPQRFTPRFSSESIIVSAHTFRSLIHFELIFVYRVRWGPTSLCYTGWSVIPAAFVEKTNLFPTELSWLLIATFNVLARRNPPPHPKKDPRRNVRFSNSLPRVPTPLLWDLYIHWCFIIQVVSVGSQDSVLSCTWV